MISIRRQAMIAVLLAGASLISCNKKFLDDNTDPNRATDVNITPELIFPAAAESVGASLLGARATAAGSSAPLQFAFNWIGYMAGNGDFARNPQETSYDIDFSFNNPLWQQTYAILFNLHQAEVKGLAQNDTAIAAASIILSAKLFQELVDFWGDIPYSQAFNVGVYSHPAYDKAQDIYKDLQLRLDTAILYMNLTPSKLFAGADIVNHGNRPKWQKLANTLKLRLLVRQSEVTGFDPSAEIAKIFGAGSQGILGAGESVSENPGYVNDVFKQSPFYANFGFTPTGIIATTSMNANQYIIDILTSHNDPRIARLFTQAGGAYVGDAYGDEPGLIPSSANSSYFGPALDSSASQDQWIFPSYESLFLLAEAAARGWVTNDPQTAYMNAVTESFVWLRVPDAANAAANYMTENDDANWANAGASPLARDRFVAFQKYIANTCIDPTESYADERRLNFLPSGFISLNPSRVSNSLPLRLLYPQSEYTTNSDNVLKEGTIHPFTDRLFWEPQ